MKTLLVQSFCGWVARTVTAYHLWCAEKELRLVDTRDMDPSLRESRERNLDVLREYRKRGEFPRHAHDKTLGLPCFIDSAGRQCAVACLMHASGDEAAALKVAKAANLARIGEMHFAELDVWASDSGFTKAELARIQPAYAPVPEQLDCYLKITTLLCVVGAFACVSIVGNAAQLFWKFGAHFWRSLFGILLGITLIGMGIYADIEQHRILLINNSTWIRINMTRNEIIAIGVGLASVFFAVIPFLLRRTAPKSTEPPEPNGLSQPPLKSAGIKKMAGWN